MIDQFKVIVSGFVYDNEGKLLVIRRADNEETFPGMLAIPGGTVEVEANVGLQQDTIENNLIRELKEETGIKVPVPVLRGNIKASRVFDAVNRSARGRTITHAFCIVLPDGPLPKVKGSDDAEKACWVPINDVQTDQCFEDHYEIVSWAIGGVS